VSTPSTQGPARVASDGAGGAYFAWVDYRSPGSRPDVYVSRLLADGSQAPGWPTNGRMVGVPTAAQQDPRIVGDGTGGVWMLWTDSRTGVVNIYYTHIRGNGLTAPGFSASGRLLSTAPGARVSPLAVPDGAGGLLVAWQDARTGTSLDVYGQHVLADGSFAPGLAVDGEPICTNDSEQLELALVDVGFDAAIVTWRDSRTGGAIVYAAPMPVGNTGLDVSGRPHAGLALATSGANPARGPLDWVVTASRPDPIMLRLVDVTGRAIETRTVQAGPGGTRVRFTPHEPGLYFVTATQAGTTITRRAISLR
jgi:hypothetical protein